MNQRSRAGKLNFRPVAHPRQPITFGMGFEHLDGLEVRARMEKKHLWVSMQTMQLDESTLRAMDKGEPSPAKLDSLIQATVGCFCCQALYHPRLNGTICPG